MRWIAVVLCALATSGCSLTRSVPPIHYYTLAVPGPPPARLPGPVEIGRFTADPPYATARLAYRVSPYRLDYYVYHRWAADPPRLLAITVRDYFADAGAPGEPLIVSAHLRRLEEVDAAEAWRGELAVDVTVDRGGRTLLARSFTASEPAEHHTPEAVVAALSRALARVLAELTRTLAASAGER
jgi:ABC-type uncharacterized transport system auxiliary subunit